MEWEESFGVIPLIRQNDQWAVFLIQHKKGRYWGFPKGHAEPNESHRESALRELKEETNLDLVRFLQDDPILEEYSFLLKGKRIFKRVHYFIAEVEGEVKLQKEEIQDGIWVPLPQALDQVTHPEGKAILVQVYKGLI